MKRFINSIIVVLLMWGGVLSFVGAWVFLLVRCGIINASLFAVLIGVSAQLERGGPHWAARFVSWRIGIAKAQVKS